MSKFSIIKYPDLTKLYRWPYTDKDNPNTVIEPTTRCNLSCPGCYRVSKLAYDTDRDMSLEEMKVYIDDVVKLRNTSCISFLGGEPLLHSQLNDAIAYVKQAGLNVGVYSNGLLMDEQKLAEFRDLGVSYVFLHVDKHQGRGDTEEQINKIREHFCDMFRRVGRVLLGFSFQFTEKDIRDVQNMCDFFASNSDIVKLLNFSLCTDAQEYEKAFSCGCNRNNGIEEIEEIKVLKHEAQKRMCKAIKEAFGLEWSSYLGSKYDDTVPGKLHTMCAYHGGKFLGSGDSATARKYVERFRRVRGNYPYNGSIPLKRRLADYMHMFVNRSARNIRLNLLKQYALTIKWQSVAISLSPFQQKEGVNFCESCTDAVLYKGKFVPMCGLEDLIKSDTRHCSGGHASPCTAKP
ncbi:MAG: radical SAM protein [Elusimicrobiota bacterium]